MSCDLYRHFDKDGQLLYVGISLSAVARLAQHRYGSPWYRSIEKITVEKFLTTADAVAAERKAIKEELPLHNRAHTKGQKCEFAKPVKCKLDKIPRWSIRNWMICWTPIRVALDTSESGAGELVEWPDEKGFSDKWLCTTGACDLRVHKFSDTDRGAFLLSTAMGLVVTGALEPEVVHKLFWPIYEYRCFLPADTPAPPGHYRFGTHAGDVRPHQ